MRGYLSLLCYLMNNLAFPNTFLLLQKDVEFAYLYIYIILNNLLNLNVIINKKIYIWENPFSFADKQDVLIGMYE